MRILNGCACSPGLREAFRARGHEAYTCDLKAAEDGSPHHIQADVLAVIEREPWDLAILHPPCTFLTSSGWHWNYRVPGRAEKSAAALQFVLDMEKSLVRAKVGKWAIENSVGRLSSLWRKPSQIVQPYNFGDDASKATCLWLYGLPPLANTGFCKPRLICKVCKGRNDYDAAFGKGCIHCGAEAGALLPRWSNQTDSGQNRLGPSEHRAADRARNYPGINAAMAEQWG